MKLVLVATTIVVVMILVAIVVFIIYKRKDGFYSLIPPTACGQGYCSGANLLGITAIEIQDNRMRLHLCPGGKLRDGDLVSICDLLPKRPDLLEGNGFLVAQVLKGSIKDIFDVCHDEKLLVIDHANGVTVEGKIRSNKDAAVTGMGCVRIDWIKRP